MNIGWQLQIVKTWTRHIWFGLIQVRLAHLHSRTFVLNCVMFMLRSGGLGNSVFSLVTQLWDNILGTQLYLCRRFMNKVFKYVTL